MIEELIRNIIKEELSKYISIGTIQCYATCDVPDCWKICDGQLLKIEDYPELYKVIGTTFGGDKDRFALPDLRGRFIRGWDMDGNIDGGREFGTYQEDAIQVHGHLINIGNDNKVLENGKHSHKISITHHNAGLGGVDADEVNNYNYGSGTKDTSSCGVHSHTLPSISIGEPSKINRWGEVRFADETRPQNIALLFCIKAK